MRITPNPTNLPSRKELEALAWEKHRTVVRFDQVPALVWVKAPPGGVGVMISPSRREAARALGLIP